MGQIFAYISYSTVLIHTPQPAPALKELLETHKPRIQEASVAGVNVAPIFQLSLQLFKTLLQQYSGEAFTLTVVSVHQAHRGWVLGVESEKVKVELIKEAQAAKDSIAYHLPYPPSSFFKFKNKINVLDLTVDLEYSQRDSLQEAPESFLVLQVKDQVHVSKVQGGVKTLLVSSNINESFHIDIINELLKSQDAQLRLNSFNSNLERVLHEGKMDKVDMLVEDIFGKENCGFIGLPPKLIAASLGKYAAASDESSTVWDSLKSILIAFAINLGQLFNAQADQHKIKKAFFISNQFHAAGFLHFIQVSRAEVWFHPHGMAADFAHRLSVLHP